MIHSLHHLEFVSALRVQGLFQSLETRDHVLKRAPDGGLCVLLAAFKGELRGLDFFLQPKISPLDVGDADLVCARLGSLGRWRIGGEPTADTQETKRSDEKEF